MRFVTLAVVVSFIMLSPLTADAQAPPPAPFVNMSTAQVKPDMVAEYEALLTEYRDAMEEAGVAFYLVFRVARGNTNEYITLTPVNALADFDGPSPAFQAMGQVAAAQWGSRITKTTLGRRVDTLRTLQDLGIPLADGRDPQLAVLEIRHNLPGIRSEYTSWLRQRWVPALRDAGVDGVFQFENAFGGRRWYQLRAIDDWAAFDEANPVAEHLGSEAYAVLMSSGGSTMRAPEIKVLALRPELSIRPQ